jgi:hypothetical protein
MMEPHTHPALVRALQLSRELLAAAEGANTSALGRLDAERLQLLQSFRRETPRVAAGDRALLQQIGQLNDQTIGLLEHRQRGTARDIDMAAVGRRAVAAYSVTRAAIDR